MARFIVLLVLVVLFHVLSAELLREKRSFRGHSSYRQNRYQRYPTHRPTHPRFGHGRSHSQFKTSSHKAPSTSSSKNEPTVTVYKDTTQEYNVSVAPSEDYDIAEPVTICLVVKFGDENVADYFSIDDVSIRLTVADDELSMLQIFNGNSSQINTTIPGNIDAAYLQTLHRACIVILPAEDKFTLLYYADVTGNGKLEYIVSLPVLEPLNEMLNMEELFIADSNDKEGNPVAIAYAAVWNRFLSLSEQNTNIRSCDAKGGLASYSDFEVTGDSATESDCTCRKFKDAPATCHN